MSTEVADHIPRYLGAAFVFQFVTSLAAGLLSAPLLDGGLSEVLRDISNSPERMRATIVLELLTSVGIIGMTALLYVVLRRQQRTLALIAFGLWMSEAVFLTVKTLALYALLDVNAAWSGSLALGVSQHAGDIDMFFFCVGAMIWYSLLRGSGIVPRALALWGLLAVPLVLVATLMLIWDRHLEPSRVLYAPYVPFELALGLWLLIKGADVSTPAAAELHEVLQTHPVPGEQER